MWSGKTLTTGLNAQWSHNYAFINNIYMHYVEQAAEPGSRAVPVVFCHGFHGEDPIALMRAIFPDLVDVQMIPRVGHMMPMEASGQLNAILLDYLSRITA